MPTQYRRRATTRALSRHRGFLSLDRRVLTLGSLVSSGMLMCIPGLPATADPIVAEVEIVDVQSYAAPSILPDLGVDRDSFDVTVFSLVQWPVPPNTTMTSAYGYRNCAGCSTDHKGIDLTPGTGFPIQSIADGVIVRAEESNSGLGVHVVVEHLIDGQKVESVYAHMEFGSIAHSVGDTVARGEQLGTVGNTGASTGPHLHFEVIIDGIQIDPHAWLMKNVNS